MKTKKLKRDKIAEITSRIALIVMCFMLIVPLGVSAASAPEYTINITNSNDIPVDEYDFGGLQFGSNVIGESSLAYINFIQSSGDITVPDGFSIGGTVRPPDYTEEIFKSTGFLVKGNIIGDFTSVFNNIFYLSNADEVLTLIPTENIVGVGFAIPPSFGIGAPCVFVNRNGASSITLNVSTYDTYRESLFEVAQLMFSVSDEPVTDEEINSEIDALIQNGTMIIVLEPEPESEPPTTPILDVWTGITNWITSSLNSVLGLFWEEGTLTYDGTLNAGDYTFNDVLSGDSELVKTAYSLDFITNNVPCNELLFTWTNVNDVDVYAGIMYYPVSGMEFLAYDLNGFTNEAYKNISFSNDQYPGYDFGQWFIDNTNYAEVNNLTGTGHLTFLGTITIIGVSIACAFLIIGIIQRFLKLRG